MDDDDVFLSKKLITVYKFFKKHSNIGFYKNNFIFTNEFMSKEIKSHEIKKDYILNKSNMLEVFKFLQKGNLSSISIKNPYLLDLDIKGSEFKIINEDSLAKFKMVRIEYSTKIEDKTLGGREEIIKRLKQLGFKNIRIYKHNYGSYDLAEHGTIEAKK